MNIAPDSNWLRALELKLHIIIAICAGCSAVLLMANYNLLNVNELPKSILLIFLVIDIFAFFLMITNLGKMIISKIGG